MPSSSKPKPPPPEGPMGASRRTPRRPKPGEIESPWSTQYREGFIAGQKYGAERGRRNGLREALKITVSCVNAVGHPDVEFTPLDGLRGIHNELVWRLGPARAAPKRKEPRR